MIGRYVQKLGIELEGADFPNGRDTEGWKPDSSVEVKSQRGNSDGECDCESGCDCGDCHESDCGIYGEGDAGEVVSEPLDSWDSVERWIRRYWPESVDRSCGLHVHLSVEAGYYSLLLEDPFILFWRSAMALWARKAKLGRSSAFMERLRGENTYCNRNALWRDPMERLDGDRYVQLNYLAWRHHGTLECRVFPMDMGPDRSLDAIRAHVAAVEEYLTRNASLLMSEPITFRSEIDVPESIPRAFALDLGEIA